MSPRSMQPVEKCKDYQKYGNNIQEYLRLYYSMVTQIDYNVGRIISELDKLGIADNTAIIFSSDHGDMQGSHGLKNKCFPFERSCGIPLIIYVPGIKQRKIVDTPVSAVDYYPTCLEIAGTKSCKTIDGESLIPLLKGETNNHKDVFAENVIGKSHWIMMREDKYKLVLNEIHMNLYICLI